MPEADFPKKWRRLTRSWDWLNGSVMGFGELRLLVQGLSEHHDRMKLHCLENGFLFENNGESHGVENGLLERLFQSGRGEVDGILESVGTGEVSGSEGKILTARNLLLAERP